MRPGCLLMLALLQPDPASLAPLYEQALDEREKQLGPDHPKVARAASDLGLYLRNLGDRQAAIKPLRRALEIDLRMLAETDARVAEDLENLASVAPAQEAMELYRRAARSSDAAIAARNLGKMGALLEAQGDRVNAADSYRQALAKEEAASSRYHPRVAVRLNDYALLLDPKAAEPLFRRALAIQQKSLGPPHPETASTLSNLANVLLATGRLAEAERLQRQALQALESALGPQHPRVAVSSSNLADILRANNDRAGARHLYERALAIDEKAYGPEHAEVAADLENLAGLLEEMGQKQAAGQLRERARKITGER